MAYEKRVCVLKQIKKGFSADGSSLSGAVYCERLGEELSVTPRMLGIAPVQEGRYALVLRVGEKKFCAELRGAETIRIQGVPSIREGFSVLLVYLRGEAEPVAFGACGSAPAGYGPLLAFLNEEGERKRKIPVPLPPFETPAPVSPNVPRAPGIPLPDPLPEEEKPFREQAAAYNDEAIADANYYGPPHADEAAETAAFGAPKEGEGDAPAETDAPPLIPRGTLTYYKEVREKLTETMKKYPRDTRLNAVFPQSEWVRAENALLGVVYENGIPRYLCVAAETDPPEAVKEHGCFVPLSPFTPEDGFWIVFQDADTGAYVTVHSD